MLSMKKFFAIATTSTTTPSHTQLCFTIYTYIYTQLFTYTHTQSCHFFVKEQCHMHTCDGRLALPKTTYKGGLFDPCVFHHKKVWFALKKTTQKRGIGLCMCVYMIFLREDTLVVWI
jgi:hypothetical protein